MNVHSIKMDNKLEFKCVLFVNVLKYKTKTLPFHKYWPLIEWLFLASMAAMQNSRRFAHLNLRINGHSF